MLQHTRHTRQLAGGGSGPAGGVQRPAWARRAPPAQFARGRGAMRCAAQQQGRQPQPPSAEEVARQAQEFARRTTRQMSDFVREKELDKKAAAAYSDASQALRTSYMRLDAEYDLSGRISSMQGRLSETAQDIDQQWNLRRKVRAAFEDAKRLAPIWKRRATQFGATTQGKATYTLLLVGLLLSGTFFKLLNLIWLGWWVSVPVSLFLADQQRRKARGEAQQRAGWGSSGGAQRGGGGGGGGSGSGWDGTGPVVEAEWVSLDDDGQPKRK